MLVNATHEALRRERGSAIVAVPLADRCPEQAALDTLASLIAHTPSTIPVLVCGGGEQVERLLSRMATESSDRVLAAMALDAGRGLAAAINAALRATAPGDLVVLLPGMLVCDGWLARLRDAAMSDTTVASATPLSVGYGGVDLLDGHGLDVGPLDRHLVEGVDTGVGAARGRSLDELAMKVAAASKQLRPRIADIGPGCAYLRRSACELVTMLDETLGIAESLADLGRRIRAAGMLNVAADDVLIGASTYEGSPCTDTSAPSAPDAIQETILDDHRAPLRRATNIGRTALRPVSVTIDGRALSPVVGGTQTFIVDLIKALVGEDAVAVRVLVPPDLSDTARGALAALSSVELLAYEQAVRGAELSDVVHRPQQVFTADDLELLKRVGERIVISQQDLIAYHNHTYHLDLEHWRSYRRIARLSLAVADQVVFFSHHARLDALSEDLVSDGRAHIVGVGAPADEPADAVARPPQGISADERFLLCLGADYAHKNRPFAIQLLAALRARGWVGRLVLAGTHVSAGSSRGREQELLRDHGELAAQVVDVGPVDDAVRRWLFRHARAIVFPTLYEGFGLLPLEAARANTPCLFAAQASLADFAAHASTLVPWDPDASADAVLPLLGDGEPRESHLARLRGISVPSWRAVGKQLVDIYRRAIADPPPAAAPRAWTDLRREGYVASLEQQLHGVRQVAHDYQDAYHSLERRVAQGLPLIDDGGLLTASQQRGLMRVASRRRLGSLLLRPLSLLGRREHAA